MLLFNIRSGIYEKVKGFFNKFVVKVICDIFIFILFEFINENRNFKLFFDFFNSFVFEVMFDFISVFSENRIFNKFFGFFNKFVIKVKIFIVNFSI